MVGNADIKGRLGRDERQKVVLSNGENKPYAASIGLQISQSATLDSQCVLIIFDQGPYAKCSQEQRLRRGRMHQGYEGCVLDESMCLLGAMAQFRAIFRYYRNRIFLMQSK